MLPGFDDQVEEWQLSTTSRQDHWGWSSTPSQQLAWSRSDLESFSWSFLLWSQTTVMQPCELCRAIAELRPSYSLVSFHPEI